MNRSSIVALVIGAMLFGCGAGMVASEVLESEADAQVAWTGQQWEYVDAKVLAGSPKYTEKVNELGRQGWELIAWDSGWAWFKRPLP